MNKPFLNDYFAFTKKERKGVFLILLMILICTILPFLFPFFIKEKKYDDTSFKQDIARLKILSSDSSNQKFPTNKYQSRDYNKVDQNFTNVESFQFDPNTATVEEWKRLGIKEKTALTIQKYLSKGGRFYKPEDLKKIWGIRPADANRLIPFVQIALDERRTAHYDTASRKPTYAPKILTAVDINSADTTSFISLPGIGPAFARRICNFRDKLGGFYSINQVAETFGLPDSTFQKIKSRLQMNNPTVVKLNINTTSLEQLKVHPYIRFNLAKAIINYREVHGPFQNVASVKNVMIVTDSIFLKLSPYLTVN